MEENRRRIGVGVLGVALFMEGLEGSLEAGLSVNRKSKIVKKKKIMFQALNKIHEDFLQVVPV